MAKIIIMLFIVPDQKHSKTIDFLDGMKMTGACRFAAYCKTGRNETSK